MHIGWNKHRGNLLLVLLLIFLGSGSRTTEASSEHQAAGDQGSELKDFDRFLDEHAAILPDLKRDPLLNPCGEVVGITTAVVPDAQNIGFAIPINLVKTVIPFLLAHGHVVRPWLGFHGQFIDNALQTVLKIPLARGFLIEVIEPGSPAEQASLQGGSLEINIAGRAFLMGGDIITRLNGRRLNSVDKVTEALQSLDVGASVSMTVFRDGKFLDVKYRLPERPLLPGDVPGQGVAAPLAGRVTKGAPTCCLPSVMRPRK